MAPPHPHDLNGGVILPVPVVCHMHALLHSLGVLAATLFMILWLPMQARGGPAQDMRLITTRFAEYRVICHIDTWLNRDYIIARAAVLVSAPCPLPWPDILDELQPPPVPSQIPQSAALRASFSPTTASTHQAVAQDVPYHGPRPLKGRARSVQAPRCEFCVPQVI